MSENPTEKPLEGGQRPQPTAGAGQPQQQQMQLDESHAAVAYANFCRVIGTPEEVIFDFALNTQTGQAPTHPIPVSQRLILNYYTAKRMLGALHMTIQRHEQAFGVLETDLNKRIKRPGG